MASATKKTAAASRKVKVDRRKPQNDRRGAGDRRTKEVEVTNDLRAGGERRKVQRRRQIDPTTCERDYTDTEVEFMRAMDEYKRASGRMFPTCSEILEVIRNLGYEKRTETPARTSYNATTSATASDAASAPALTSVSADADHS